MDVVGRQIKRAEEGNALRPADVHRSILSRGSQQARARDDHALPRRRIASIDGVAATEHGDALAGLDFATDTCLMRGFDAQRPIAVEQGHDAINYLATSNNAATHFGVLIARDDD